MIARINIGLQQDILEQNQDKSSTSFYQLLWLGWILYSGLVSRRLAQKSSLIFSESWCDSKDQHPKTNYRFYFPQKTQIIPQIYAESK